LVPQLSAADLSSVRVVSLYESIIDTDISSLTRILYETHTQIVFRAYFRGFYRNLNQIDYLKLVQVIRELKAKLPGIRVMGAISCSVLIYPGDYWPNGILVSESDSMHMLWILPNGTFGRHPSYPWPILDIEKPLARQFIVEYAYKLIDAGVDMIFFDEVSIVLGTGSFYGLKISEQSYTESWEKIVHAAKDYARQKYGKELLVTLNNGYVNSIGEPPRELWPYQDFISVSVNPKTIKTQSIQDDWPGFKAQVRRVYGRPLPIIAFMDWGAGDTPLSMFAVLSREDQIKTLKLLHKTALSEGLVFAYPLRGGALNGSITYIDYNNTYDAIKQGTFDTVVQLTGSLENTYSQTSTSVTSNGTTGALESDWIVNDSYLVVGLVIAVAVGFTFIEMKRRRLPPGGCNSLT
jgi:hypothetical protein